MIQERALYIHSLMPLEAKLLPASRVAISQRWTKYWYPYHLLSSWDPSPGFLYYLVGFGENGKRQTMFLGVHFMLL